MSSRLSHLQGVRLLYKSCLKLHRGLPLELKAIGDSYVKEEFRRHKEASPEHSKVFMQQWAKYVLDLSDQLQKSKGDPSKIGQNLEANNVESLFTAEQIVQLYELHKEASKPVEKSETQ